MDAIRLKTAYKELRALCIKDFFAECVQKNEGKEEILLYQAYSVYQAGELISLLKEQIKENFPLNDYEVNVCENAHIIIQWGEAKKRVRKERDGKWEREERLRREEMERDSLALKAGVLFFLFPILVLFLIVILIRIQRSSQ